MQTKPKIIDTHAHLNHEDFEFDYLDIIEKLPDYGIEKIINVGFDLQSSIKAKELSKHDCCYFAVGIHPYDAKSFDNSAKQTMLDLAKQKKCLAIGEIGLDYHLSKEDKEIQKKAFISQIELADELMLPIIVHMRDATKDCLEILEEYKPKKNAIMHCFSDSKETALILVERGFYISFSGTVTFRNANKFEEIIKSLPEDKILIETDCPYLAPHPKRGNRNEPKLIRFTLDKICDILQKDMSDIIFQNSLRAFSFDK